MSRRTKNEIVKTFLELLKEHSLDKITVKDIVEDCGVNRNTFYYYYRDIYDLARQIFAEGAWGVGPANGCPPEERVEKLARYMRENRRAIRNMYRSVGRDAAEKYLSGILGDMPATLVADAAAGCTDRDALQRANRFVLHTAAGLLFDWLDEGMKTDPQVLGEAFLRLARGGLQAYFEKP